jgi:hypothetical protein
MGFFSDRVEDVFRALDRLRRGDTLGQPSEDDISWFERTVGLKRPLRSYSARSQRRFKQRFREGATSAKDVYKREYTERKTKTESTLAEHSLTPSQWRTIEALRNRVQELGVETDGYLDDDALRDVADLYGYQYMRQVLTEQIDSTEQYLRGNPAPGNKRWNNRGVLEAKFGASAFFNYAQGTNPYYFYHGRKQ